MKTYANLTTHRRHQRGAVVIVLGVTLVMLIGFIGLALDLGRFFVIKSELQNAMDACALSAASQLRPGANDSNVLIRATAYGKVFTTGGQGNSEAIKNKVNFQSTSLNPDLLEITFGQNNNDSPYNATSNTARFVKCSYPLADLPIYFMQVLTGVSTGTVSAFAVATRDEPIAGCIPVSVCSAAGGTPANNFGYSVGDWITAYDGTPYGTGNFGWVDFTPPAGGASEIKAILAGSKQCNIAKIGDLVNATGTQTTLQEAWNSRFGWYRNGGSYSPAEAPPDKTGFAYSNLDKNGLPNGGNWPSGFNAYSGTSSVPNQPNFSDAVTGARAVNRPYQETIPEGIKTNQYATPLQAADLAELGRLDRRVVAAPVVDCSIWNTPPGNQQTPILGWACVLMLNPIGGGSAASETAKLEFLGLSSNAGNPCSGGSGFAIAPVLTQ